MGGRDSGEKVFESREERNGERLKGGLLMNKPMVIYVSGPYSAPTWEGRHDNLIKAVCVGIEIRLKGHYPVIPHLYDDFDQIAKTMGHNFDWQSYMDMDIELLSRCEAMYFIGPSPGANIEFRHAQELDMPIYLSLDEVPELKKEEGLQTSEPEPPDKAKCHAGGG